MRLADLVYGVWALMPESLLELQSIYETHVRGDKIDIKAIEARLGRPLANEQRGYEVVNGVAVLSVQGAISPKANLMSQISGGASAQLFVRDVNAAAEDPTVKGGVLAMDTPGGNVLGIPAARDAVRNFAARKPIATHSDGVLASAGYWIGGAANRVYIADSMVQVGSIGVVFTDTDTTQAESKAGIKKTVITAGKFKRMERGADGALTEESYASLQQKADYVYSIFVGNVAEDLGVSVETVLEDMADGRVFIGQQAIDAGLVDGVSTLDALIEAMATNPAKFAQRRKAQVRPAGSPKSIGAGAALEGTSLPAEAPAPAPATPEVTTMITLETLKTEHPDVHAQAIAALIERMAADGATTGDQAAAAVLAAERGVRTAAATAHANDAPAAAPAAHAPEAAAPTAKSIAASAVALFRNAKGEK
jgi:capsid assembly protease